jgi:hypothetical protein
MLLPKIYLKNYRVFLYDKGKVWHVARMGEDRGVHRVLVGKPEGKEAITETKT